MPDDVKTFMVEDARLVYRNFSGAETMFKPEGTRSFSVVLDKATADRMVDDGWNVKCKVPQEPGDEEFCHIEVTVGYKSRPPKIVVITETSRTMLNEDTVGMLDWADIRTVDLISRAYAWEVGGKSGIKAYLQSMFVTIEEDALERKYANGELVEDTRGS